MKRALRRHQKEIQKKRARHLFKHIWWHTEELADSPRFVGMYGRTRKICSCSMCRPPKYNRRKPKNRYNG